mmetsp:Transcript_6264/g.7213  ORF Transcript_6264/g.7213 Transcript_6264/m.7213 type:complete len:93 (-) Transcript_6264:61-339(-)
MGSRVWSFRTLCIMPPCGGKWKGWHTARDCVLIAFVKSRSFVAHPPGVGDGSYIWYQSHMAFGVPRSATQASAATQWHVVKYNCVNERDGYP